MLFESLFRNRKIVQQNNNHELTVLLNEGSPLDQVTWRNSEFPFLILGRATKEESASWFFLRIEWSNRIHKHLFTSNNYVSLTIAVFHWLKTLCKLWIRHCCWFSLKSLEVSRVSFRVKTKFFKPPVFQSFPC